MDILQQHELFEIEALDAMNSARLFSPLVFGGGTMLRLCHGLNRYSADLDFWFVRQIDPLTFMDKLDLTFKKTYEVTDAQLKRYTLLMEIRSSRYPKRLKIEIRRESKPVDFQENIAFSPFSTTQVAVRTHTLQQSMLNKVDAFLNRHEIRDCFDIEFLLRRGIPLPDMDAAKLRALKKQVSLLKETDFKVKLGAIVDNATRAYYVANRFAFLMDNLTQKMAPRKSRS